MIFEVDSLAIALEIIDYERVWKKLLINPKTPYYNSPIHVTAFR
jgi:hypothetical protein